MQKELKLNEAQQDLLALLFYYRGATAIQLAKMNYGTDAITVSNEKYTYKQLRDLEEIGFVTRNKLNSRISNYAMYQLNRKGLELFQTGNDLVPGQLGTGWIGDCELEIGYFEYAVYTPPLKQAAHHLVLIDVFVILIRLNVMHRNNLYAKRVAHYDQRYKPQIIKPDGEMIINGESYTIEIDRGTESHDQLVEKFNRYFHYVAEYRNNNNGKYDIHNIVFVVSGEDNGHLQRRWTNILAAYYKGLRGLHDRFNLYLVPLDKFEHFVRCERDYDEVNFDFLTDLCKGQKLKCTWSEPGAMNKATVKKIGRMEENTLLYKVISTPYSSLNLHACLAMCQSKLNFLTSEVGSLYLPKIDTLSNYNVNQEILDLYNKSRKYVAVTYYE